MTITNYRTLQDRLATADAHDIARERFGPGAVMPTRFPLPVIAVKSCPMPPEPDMLAAFQLGEQLGYSHKLWGTTPWTPRGLCWRLVAEFYRGFAYGSGCRTRE